MIFSYLTIISAEAVKHLNSIGISLHFYSDKNRKINTFKRANESDFDNQN
ncbi:hypothetical protein BAOM_1865 [Peribacillus asahii]|uniref:Uncharacterized protein n=1 Tax=Peribacillus asahii TaxID=228899 RepID=A0A3Q9RLU6_9BACI|nr:hypothetical protein BAOM_1865 [Peribacillus asahii]